MINSASSSDRVLRPEGVVLHAKPAPADTPATDRFSPEHSAALKSALQNQPEIRPEVVARGRALAADASWPTPAILRQIGGAILASEDPSDQAD
jgi:hypothetical protein